MSYDPQPGTSIDRAVNEAYAVATKSRQEVFFDFNECRMVIDPLQSEEDNRVKCRAALGLPAIDPPFHPQTAQEALKRWDDGQSVFTVEMGGLGPGYEQAIHTLVFEIIRDQQGRDLPEPKSEGAKTWGNWTVSRIDSKFGFSGAQVGAARSLAYRAIRDGWETMLKSAPQNRHIQVSKHFPTL